MVEPTRIPERQLDLGAASYFRVVPEDPPGNQVTVNPGFVYAGAFAVSDAFTAGGQTTPGFAPVAGGQQRYDLVYLDQNGVAAIQQGTPVAFGTPGFSGAPGFTGGPDLVDNSVPLAYVFVDEVGAVVVDSADITLLGGQFHVGRDLEGYLVDKGLLGAAPTGTSDDVSALFAADKPGGGITQRGVVTAPPLNYVSLVNQVGDEVKHTTGARMYGRITEAAGVWTLSYFYVDAAGAEQPMDPSTDAAGVAPTDIQLIGTPVVFSRNDPTRPLFQSSVQRLSDQLVGTVPTATTTVQGIGLKADNPGTKPAVPVIGTIAEIQDAGVEVAGGPWHTLNFPAGGVGPGASPGVLDVAVVGPPGPAGPAGPPGPGFSNFVSGVSGDIDIPNGAFTVNFGTAFNWRMAAIGCTTATESTSYDAAWCNSISGVGTTVVTGNMQGRDASPSAIACRVWYSASG